MHSYMAIVKSYWSCIKNATRASKDEEHTKKLAECKRSLVERLVGLINAAWRHGLSVFEGVDRVAGGFGVVRVRARLVYRGRPGSGELLLPLEWGLLVHPVFLVPYFPGSAVKGVMRASYISMLERYGGGGGAVESCVRAFFGSASDDAFAGVGGVVALDAYPVEAGRGGAVVLGDVISPHYGGGERIVTELDVSPRPVIGVSVAEGVVFEFVVLVDPGYVLERIPPDLRGFCLLGWKGGSGAGAEGRVLSVAGAMLVNALTGVGIGGKTTRGYGFFDVLGMRIERPRRPARP